MNPKKSELRYRGKWKRWISGALAAIVSASCIPSTFAFADSDDQSDVYVSVSNVFNICGTTVDVDGNILSATDITCSGYMIDIDGNCYYSNHLNNYCGFLTYDDAIQNETPVMLPELGDGLNYAYNLFSPTKYDNSITFDWQESVSVDAIYSNDGIDVYGNSIQTKDIIGAKNSISFNSTYLTTEDNAETYLYSANGDIIIQANTVNLEGVIYAPNGKALISGSNLNFSGIIIANEIDINGDTINLSKSDSTLFNLDYFENAANNTNLLLVGDYYPNESKLTLSWKSDQFGDDFSVYASIDENAYSMIANTTESSYDYMIPEGCDRIDFYVEHELPSGHKLVSNILTLVADENGNYSLLLDDSDGDGLYDVLEDYLGTDKNNPDTDDDGLTDFEEIYDTFTNPTKYDTDSNGICDADEDVDEDGLSFRNELDISTNPFNSDTDSDTLTDGDEVNTYHTNPLIADTDGDGLLDSDEFIYNCDPYDIDTDDNGILDGDELFTVTKTSNNDDSAVSVELTMTIPGRNIRSLSIDAISEDDVFLPSIMPGYIGNGYDFYVDCEFDEATMKFTFDKDLLEIEDFEPAVYYCDIVNQEMVLLPDQIVDMENCTVTAKTTHFSRYILLNKTEFSKVWDEDFINSSEDDDGNQIGMDIVLAIDSSGSMSWNDPSDIRKDAAKQFVESLRDIDRAAIVDFDSSAQTYQTLTSDLDSLYSAINLIDSTGGTSLSSGMSEAISNFGISNTDTKKIIIMLTDGRGNYNSSYTQTAIQNKITIYTIGLGYDIDENLLKTIATSTGGKYYHADAADDLNTSFSNIEKDIGTSDTDGDTFPDVVEDNLYWFNGVSLSKATKPSDIDLYLGFDSNNPNTFYKYLNDGQIVREYKKIAKDRYEAKLLDGAIWDIPNFQEMLKEKLDAREAEKIREQEKITEQQLEVCYNLESYGIVLTDEEIGHHVLAYHSGSQTYVCEYCGQEFIDPETQDNEIMYEEDDALVYTLNRMQSFYKNYYPDAEIAYGISRIKDKVRSSYTCNNRDAGRIYCPHDMSGGHDDDGYCTPYSTCNMEGKYVSPLYYCQSTRTKYSLDDYQFEVGVNYNTWGETLTTVTLLVGAQFLTDKAVGKFIDNYLKEYPFETKEIDNIVANGMYSGAKELLKENESAYDEEHVRKVMNDNILIEATKAGLGEVPYLGVVVKAGAMVEDFIEYTENAVNAVRRLPENYVTYFTCRHLDGENADYFDFTFDLYREYYSTISSDFSWGFYNPDNPYGTYENDSDIVAFSNYKDIPRTTLKPMGVQFWGYYEIEYMDCQKKSDSSDDSIFFESDWSGMK